MKFEEALRLVLRREGGYVNHPSDPGGETMHGITLRVARMHGYSGSMRDMPFSVAADIYRATYWNAIQAEKLPEDLRFHVFDAAVNSGPSQAVKWLQACAGVTGDGIVGPKTIAAASTVSAAHYSATRLRFMTSLPTWGAFGRGWARRICENLDLIR